MAQNPEIEHMKNLVRNWVNAWLQSLDESDADIFSNLAQINETQRLLNNEIDRLPEERKRRLECYYGRILTHESFLPVYLETLEMSRDLVVNSRSSDDDFMEGLVEKIKEMLRKFLDVEITLNDSCFT